VLRLILLQENNEKQEERLAKCTLELAGACVRYILSKREVLPSVPWSWQGLVSGIY
jgi:hypothetical protein